MNASTTSVPTGEVEFILRGWRDRTMTIILIVVAVAVLPAVIATAARVMELGATGWAVFLGGMYLLLAAVTLFSQIDYRVRGSAVLLMGYAAAIFAFLVGGLAGDGRIFLTVMPVFAFVLLGIRTGWVATALSLLVYLIFGIVGSAGAPHGLESWLLRAGSPFDLGFWGITWATLAALLLPTVALLDRFHRLQLNTLKAERLASARLAQAYDNTLVGWARALEARDHETEGHCRRVTELTLRLARAAGLDAAELVDIYRGALLHDIGKMGIPDRILLKPGPLTDEEWTIMRKHSEYGYQLLSSIEYLHPALGIPYCHHEKWDGTGYPQHLKGGQIPFAARLFAVADVWDALRSDRPYRKAWTEETVREYIRSMAGTQFDPEAVKIFFSLNVDGGS